jgi:hypothetical protein
MKFDGYEWELYRFVDGLDDFETANHSAEMQFDGYAWELFRFVNGLDGV